MVDWYQVSLIGVDHLAELNDILSPLTTSSFTLLPKGKNDKDRSRISLSVLRPPREMITKLKPQAWQEVVFPNELEVLKAKHSDPGILSIRSSPYGLVNPAIFMDYLSSGNISYISAGENDKIQFILSDTRYLDGMDGGSAFISNSTAESVRCIGLVAGALKKHSGEGDMTVIVPWSTVLKYVTKHVKHVPSQLSSDLSVTDFVIPWLSFNGVLMIEVQYTNVRKGWGSGILLDDTTVVSNMHLLGNNHQSATAWISETEYVPLEILGNPLPGLDIMFFKLTKPISSSKSKPVTLYKGSYKVGQPVRSLGYGLIYPHGTGSLPFQPLTSNGIIARSVCMDLYRDFDLATRSVEVSDSGSQVQAQAKSKDHVLLVSTAGCWNGSSGGALFDAATGHVISMMTSNGRVNETGEVIPQMAFSLPSEVLQHAWDLLKNGQKKKVSQRVTSLWKLEETHVNSLVESTMASKL